MLATSPGRSVSLDVLKDWGKSITDSAHGRWPSAVSLVWLLERNDFGGSLRGFIDDRPMTTNDEKNGKKENTNKKSSKCETQRKNTESWKIETKKRCFYSS